MMTSVVEKSSVVMHCARNNKKCKAHGDECPAPDAVFEQSLQRIYGPHGVCPKCGEENSDGATEEANDEVDWCDSARSELQSLVVCYLDAVFNIALKRIVACGYSEEAATKAMMSPEICYGTKDTLSNIVDKTLKFLKTCKASDLRHHDYSMDLKGLEDYLMAEFIYFLKVVRPYTSTGDMLWYLLVSDLNVSDVCAVAVGRYDIRDAMNSNSSSHLLSKNQIDDATRRLDMNCGPHLLRHMSSSAADFQRDFSSPVPNMIESNKTLNPKQGRLSGLTIDKKTRSSGECYPKNASMKKNKALEVKISEDRTKGKSTTAKGSANPTNSLCKRCVASSLYAASIPNKYGVGPVDISNRCAKLKDANGKSTKPDPEYEMIYQLISTIYKLKDRLEQWTEWANSRVMQATLSLTKHKDELSVLRQEKRDPEKLKQSIKENTLRKISEIENALSQVNEQVELANCTVGDWEVKNSALKRVTDVAKLEAVESAANCNEISERERSAMSSVKSLDKQKSSLHEEMISLKKKYEYFQNEFIQAQGVLAQLEAKREHESNATKDLLLKASSIKMEIEQVEALQKFKEDAFRSNAEVNLQKYKEKIQMLKREVVKLNLSAEANQIASPVKGLNDGEVSWVISSSQKCPMLPDAQLSHMRKVAQNSSKKSSKDVMHDRECVMCLSDEVSVVFLPCAHQAICAKCSDLHEKNGMKDCPSCRSVIQQRIAVRYHVV